MDGYVAEIDDAVHYDPDEARRFLAEAGATDLEFSIILNGTEPSESIATIVQDQLAKVGVTVTTKKFTPTEAATAWRKGEAGSYSNGALLGGDPTLFLEQYQFGFYTLGEPDQAIAESYSRAMGLQLDDPARADAFGDVARALDSAPVHLPLVRGPVDYLTRPGVVGLEEMTFSQMGFMPEIRVLGRTD